MRLNIPAGTAVRFEPGEEKEVTLVEFGGNRNIHGFNNLAEGSVASDVVKLSAMNKATLEKFKNTTA